MDHTFASYACNNPIIFSVLVYLIVNKTLSAITILFWGWPPVRIAPVRVTPVKSNLDLDEASSDSDEDDSDTASPPVGGNLGGGGVTAPVNLPRRSWMEDYDS